MNAIYEALFCPMHGLLMPANWPMVAIAVASVKSFFAVRRFNHVRRNGAF